MTFQKNNDCPTTKSPPLRIIILYSFLILYIVIQPCLSFSKVTILSKGKHYFQCSGEQRRRFVWSSLFSVPSSQKALLLGHPSEKISSSVNNEDEIEWVPTLPYVDEKKENKFSIVSWNVLAQKMYDAHHKDEKSNIYQNPHLDWSTQRGPQICQTLFESNASIICLQEVEPRAYVQLIRFLEELGYDGIYSKSKRVRPSRVATFWKRNLFTCTWSKTRSRTLTTFLTSHNDNDKRSMAVVNCHLEGHPEKITQRVTQLQHAIRDISNHNQYQNTDGVVVCGDFNSIIRQSACTNFLLSFHDDNLLEFGKIPLPPKVKKIPNHDYKDFQSAYPFHLDKKRFFTFCAMPHKPVYGIDQIWFTSSTLSTQTLLWKFSNQNQNDIDSILSTGLPNDLNPSDHLPIGCVFDWNSPPLS